MGRAITIAIQREGVGASGSRSDGASGSRSDEQSARRRTSIMNWSKKLSLYTSLVAKGSTFSAAGPLDDEGGEAEDLVRVCGRALEGIEPLALPEPGIRPDESRSICIYSADAKRPVCGCVGLWSRAVDEKGAKKQRVCGSDDSPSRRPFNSTSRTPFRHSARPVAFYHGFQHGAFHTIHNTRGARRNTQCSELRRSAVRVSPRRRRRRRRRLAPGRITDGLDTDARGTYGKSV
jgi:hypothetical protein